VHSSDLEEQRSNHSEARKEDPFSYLAKYVTKQGGELSFGGTLLGVNFNHIEKSRKPIGKAEVVTSANLRWQLFHMNFKGRKR
jgi:hypothetical protein